MKKQTHGQVNFLVQIERGQDIGRVADALRAKGLQIERQLPSAGVIGGFGRPSLFEPMRQIPGVQFVRQEGEVHLPPMRGDFPQ